MICVDDDDDDDDKIRKRIVTSHITHKKARQIQSDRGFCTEPQPAIKV
jgi:hypothetical protein